MKTRFSCHKPDILFLLALFVSLGMFLSTSTLASESLFSKQGLAQLLDGDVQLAPVGHGGGGLHMTFESPSQENHAMYVSKLSNNPASTGQGVYLSIQLPW